MGDEKLTCLLCNTDLTEIAKIVGKEDAVLAHLSTHITQDFRKYLLIIKYLKDTKYDGSEECQCSEIMSAVDTMIKDLEPSLSLYLKIFEMEP